MADIQNNKNKDSLNHMFFVFWVILIFLKYIYDHDIIRKQRVNKDCTHVRMAGYLKNMWNVILKDGGWGIKKK